jgi:Methyltransferase domain
VSPGGVWDLPRSARPRRSGWQRGRKKAETLGVALKWVEADAQALPFGDEEFDVVTSSFGIIFAPDHQKVAAEMCGAMLSVRCGGAW